MPHAETAITGGHPLTRAGRALAAACALSAAADELLHSGPGLRVGDRREVVAWLRGRADLLAAAAGAADRCAADDGWGRCYAAPVVDGYCPTHAAEDRSPSPVADLLSQLVVDDGCPACTADLVVSDSGVIVCSRGCDYRGVVGDASDLVVDDAGWARVGVAIVALAWVATAASWCWLMVLAWRAFIRWGAAA